MKIQFYQKDAAVIRSFLAGWAEDSRWMGVWATDDCPPLYLDCPPEELANCFDALRKEGFTQSIKRLCQGDHFYRSDTGKCPRCWRYRPEIHWNNENLPEAKCCDRCNGVLHGERDGS